MLLKSEDTGSRKLDRTNNSNCLSLLLHALTPYAHSQLHCALSFLHVNSTWETVNQWICETAAIFSRKNILLYQFLYRVSILQTCLIKALSIVELYAVKLCVLRNLRQDQVNDFRMLWYCNSILSYKYG